MKFLYSLTLSSFLLLAIGLFFDTGFPSNETFWLVGASLICLGVAFAFSIFQDRDLNNSPGVDGTPALIFSICFFLLLNFIRRPGIYLEKTVGFLDFTPFLLLVALLLLGVIIFQKNSRGVRWGFGLIVLLFLISSIWVVLNSPSPIMDVWTVQQGAAQALLEGKNPFSHTYQIPRILPGVTHDNRFVYLPYTFLLTSPFYFFLGDIRYANLICRALSGVLIFLIARKTGKKDLESCLLGTLFLIFPRATFLLEQAWTEPTITVLIFASVYFYLAKKNTLTAVFSGLVLGAKQFMLPVAPLLVRYMLPRPRQWGLGLLTLAVITVPFLIWGPMDFIQKVVGFHLHRPFRLDALTFSVLAYRNFGWLIPTWIPFLFLGATILIGLRSKKIYNFALTSALAYFFFFIFNKIAFFNYYFFVGSLILLALATLPGRSPKSSENKTSPPVSKEPSPEAPPRRFNATTFYLIILNLFVLNVLFFSRYDNHTIQTFLYRVRSGWEMPSTFEKFRLYYSHPQDLLVYYKYANRALGYSANFEEGDILKGGSFIQNTTMSYKRKYYPRKLIKPLHPAKWNLKNSDFQFKISKGFPVKISERTLAISPWPILQEFARFDFYPEGSKGINLQKPSLKPYGRTPWVLWYSYSRRQSFPSGGIFQLDHPYSNLSLTADWLKIPPLPSEITGPVWKGIFWRHNVWDNFQDFARLTFVPWEIGQKGIVRAPPPLSLAKDNASIPMFNLINWDEAFYYLYGRLDPTIHPVVYEDVLTQQILDQRGGREIQLPYRDFLIEYPPLALVPILYARLISHDFASFGRAYSVLVSLAAMGSLWFAFLILKLRTKNYLESLNELLLYSFLALLAIGLIFPTRLDIFPAFLTIFALWALVSNRYLICSIALALAVMMKIFPIIFIPILGLTLIARKKYKTIAFCILAFGVVILAINFPFVASATGKYLDSFFYHADRPIQMESLYGNLLFLQNYFENIPLRVVHSFGSANLISPIAGFYLWTYKILFPLVTGILYLIFFGKIRKTSKEDLAKFQINFFILLTLAFIVTCKVFSPQFLIWLFPILFLIHSVRKTTIVMLYLLACVLSQIIYPKYFHHLEFFDPTSILFLTLRNATVLFLFGIILYENSKRGRPLWQETPPGFTVEDKRPTAHLH